MLQKKRKCIEEGCKTQPSYGVLGGKRLHCKIHALSYEIDIANLSKMCVSCGLRRASYGYKINKKTHCSSCKKEDQTNFTCSKKCVVCKQFQPSFCLPNENIPQRCKTCSIPGDINTKARYNLIRKYARTNRLCTGCKEQKIVDENHIYCARCSYDISYFNSLSSRFGL